MADSTHNIVRIEEVEDSIYQTLEKVFNAVARARQVNMEVLLPEQVDFAMTVVMKWQELEVNSTAADKSIEEGTATEKATNTEKGTQKDTGTALERQGGYSQEEQDSTQKEDSAESQERRSSGSNSHIQKTKETTITESA